MKKIQIKVIQVFCTRYRELWLIFAFICYSLLLCTNITRTPLFIGDEHVYADSVHALLNGTIDGNDHPLLIKTVWYIIVYFFSGLTGQYSPFFWRLGTILFSLATLLVFYKICRLFFSPVVSMMGVVLLALDPIFFSFSRVLELDVPVTFFILTSSYFFLLFIRQNQRRSKLIDAASIFLGLSYASKLSALLLLIFIPLFIFFYTLKKWSLNDAFWAIGHFFLYVLIGYVGGQSIFFFKRNNFDNFFAYNFYLLHNQLAVHNDVGKYLSSPAWSWFLIPQVLTLYRYIYKNGIDVILAFQNPLLYIATIPTIFLTVILFIKHKINNPLSFALLLVYFISLYLPWFFVKHTPYYYYIIPLLPYIILLFINVLQKIRFGNSLLMAVITVSTVIFFLYFPLLVGIRVKKSYEKLLFSYSLYAYPKVDTFFCQFCSPRK